MKTKKKKNQTDSTLRNVRAANKNMYRLQEAFCTLCAWLVDSLGHENASELILSVYTDNRINKKTSFKRAKKRK